MSAPETLHAVRGGPSLHRKLVWLNLFRLVLNTVLLGGTASMTLSARPTVPLGAEPLHGLVLLTFVGALGVALALRARRNLAAVAWVQLFLDLGIAAVVVGLTGFGDSVFVFLFLLAIVNGGMVQYRRGAVLATGIALAAHFGSAWLLGPGLTRAVVFAQGAAFLATGALATYLSELLRATGERLAERESDLAAITALHESIVQSVTSGLLTLDDEGRVTFLNRAGEQMTGIPLASVRGTPAASAFSGFRTDMARGETEFVTARGERLHLGYSAFPLLDGVARRIGHAVIFQDLTERKQMEERVARSERLADLGGVAAGLAHELRNPLASMMGSLELLRQNPGLGGEDRRLMEIALREAGRLEQLVSHFLAFARPAPPLRVRCDLGPIVAETLDVFAHDRSATVSTERSLGAAPAYCDPAQMKQVIWNLLRNAAEATGERSGNGGGRVRAACGADASGPWLAVEDDGPGISSSDRTRVFLPFFTTKREGSGLGLPTVHRIVEAHGGTVSVEAAEGGGARFVVRLPRAPQDVASAAEEMRTSAPWPRS